MRTKITSLIAVAALALVAIGGAFAYNKVSAQSPTPTVVPAAPGGQTTPNNQTAPNGQNQKGWKGGPDNQVGGAQDQELATALGITLEKLQAGFKTANEAALKEAVTKGLLTQAQADQITTNGIASHPMREFGRPNATTSVDYNTLLANALGITTDQLKAAQQKVDDARLAAAVTSGQMTQAQADLIKARQALAADSKFQSGLQSAIAASVKQAVTDGVITQAQADAILADQATAGFPGMGGRDGFGGPGGPGGRGGHGRGGPGDNLNNQNPPPQYGSRQLKQRGNHNPIIRLI
jgi:hypothetical protein